MLFRVLAAVILCCLFSSNSFSDTSSPKGWERIFPQATSIGEKESNPPVWPVYQAFDKIGYVFHSIDYVTIPAFSGEPVDMLVGLDLDGQFTGVELIEHREPIFLHGLGEKPLIDFIRQYEGLGIRDNVKVGSGTSTTGTYIDGITKATVSVVVINQSIVLSALAVARQKLSGFEAPADVKVKSEYYEQLSLEQLQEENYLQNLRLTESEIQTHLYDYRQNACPECEHAVDLKFGYLNVPSIGRVLLGDSDFERLQKTLEPDEHAVVLLSNGDYSFIDLDFVPASVPDRVSIDQRGFPIEIRDLNFFDVFDPQTSILNDASDVKVFSIKPQTGFNPASEWNLLLNISAGNPVLYTVENYQFMANYSLPKKFFDEIEIISDGFSEQPLWVGLWESKRFQIIVLLISLAALTVIFARQHQLVKNPKRFHAIRWGFLTFTLIYIGWYAQGQLSIVNIYPILQSFTQGFNLETYLMDPIIFILWLYVFISLFIVGRGLFCGWLCPFGALQEMVSWFAKKLKIKQYRVKPALHNKLTWMKYAILIGLVLTSFYSVEVAEVWSEVEPFKTSITLHFVRTWPFVVYAIFLLGCGLFIHKFYCRYVCPLGAGLAVLGWFHPVKWLKRRSECGTPCTLCYHKCEIKAIKQSGEIDYKECIQCLECIVYHNNDDLCPPQKVKIRKQAKRKKAESLIPATAVEVI